MSADNKKHPRPAMRKTYDFSDGVRGRYAAKFGEGTNLILLEPEIQEYFPDSKAVNDALRLLVRAIKARRKKEDAAT